MVKATRAFSDDVYVLFEKLGVIVKKVPQQPILASGVPIPVGDNLYALVKDGKEFFRGAKKEVDELVKKLDELSDLDAKKYLDEFSNINRKFIFKNFSSSFDGHIQRVEIQIKIKNAQTNEIRETYTYYSGKGGRNASEIIPPWQVIKSVKGLHMHKYIDNIHVRIKEVKESKFLHTGEQVDIVKIESFIKELNQWSKKKKPSTLWPKEWSIEKIRKITEEASENVYWDYNRKFKGKSKEGYEIEFFSGGDGVIDNAYLITENL